MQGFEVTDQTACLCLEHCVVDSRTAVLIGLQRCMSFWEVRWRYLVPIHYGFLGMANERGDDLRQVWREAGGAVFQGGMLGRAADQLQHHPSQSLHGFPHFRICGQGGEQA